MKTFVLSVIIVVISCAFSLAQDSSLSSLKLMFEFTQPVQIDPTNMQNMDDPLSLVSDTDSLYVYALFTVSDLAQANGFYCELGSSLNSSNLFSGTIYKGELSTGRHSSNNNQVKVYLGKFKKESAFYLNLKMLKQDGAYGQLVQYNTAD